MVRQVTEFETADDLVIYPESDGLPMAENTVQFRWIVTIKENLEILFAANPDVFVAGDLFWYPIQGNIDIRYAPDTMVVFGRPKGDRGSYIQSREANIPPQVVFEILSPGNTKKEMKKKLEFYDKYGVEEYYLYDPKKNNLTGWSRSNNSLEQITNINGWTSPSLKIKFVLTPTTLEIYRLDGRKFLTPVELEQERQLAQQIAEAERRNAEAERQRAERLAAKLRLLGEDPDLI
ncbi:MAG: Uma2 family endonuclease [Scytonematopsis contorta HA4267-MV1]|jgi:Uma2 family endonuclease|nr:Uma2 family endonuclease [Scytonematopsis contorta HA4267-MV1]